MNNEKQGHRTAYCNVLATIQDMICAEKYRCLDAITETDRQWHNEQVVVLERIRAYIRKNRETLLAE